MNYAVKNMIEKYGYSNQPFTVVLDDGYEKLCETFETVAPKATIKKLRDYGKENIPELAKELAGQKVLLLAEPQSYGTYRLALMFDFEKGEPEIPGCESTVLIFPVDTLISVLRVDLAEDLADRDRILREMKDGGRYLLVNDAGTRLQFTARKWIPLDFEVCTAPVEETIEGELVVDGAVFFRKNNREMGERIVLTIEHGKVVEIRAHGGNGEKLLQEYKNMIASSIEDPVNLQLAEIGIGFCKGASVSDCFMEAEIARATCHCCFGNNICYGGNNSSEFHGNSVLMLNPVFELVD